MSKALSLQPHVRSLLKKGITHHQAGRRKQAEFCYRRSLKADPRCPQALHLLGLLAQQAGQYAEAVRLMQESLALNPDDPDTLNSLADAHFSQGQRQAACDCCRRVAELLPQSAEAHHRLGQAEECLKNWDAAIAAYRRALALRPDSPDFYSSLARVQYEQMDYAGAVESCRRALALDPNRHEIHIQTGQALTDLGEYGPAVEALRRALALKPDSAQAVYGLGYFFERKGDLGSAEESYRTALTLDPSLKAAYLHLGIARILHGDLANATQCFEQVLRITPDSAEARSFLGLIHLTQGNYSAGWQEYEDRRGTPQFLRERRTFIQPTWRGQPLAGSRILLHAEQGLGDTLQFVRYVPLVAAKGGKVILEVPARLRRLLAETPGAERVVCAGEALPDFDWQCPLLSLPLAFATDMSSIPARIPYIQADPVQAEAWSRRMPGDSLRVGLAWGGSPLHPYNGRRSISLELLAPLTGLAGTRFYSLQMGEPADQVRALGSRVHLIDLKAEQGDFADTAAIVANLDLVISIDTSVVHLAGAMGKPAWVLLSNSPDWRWMLDRQDSPWYPTVRLFRRSTAGNWRDVVACVERELRALVATTASALARARRDRECS
jgi:tetratricopeptide (TPR) repeat protein